MIKDRSLEETTGLSTHDSKERYHIMELIEERLYALRQAMRAQQVEAWVALTADPHLSEYLPDYWKTREFLSGFTGSAGILVVTFEVALLWTDSRYWDQAQRELKGTSISLRYWARGKESPWDWIFRTLKPGQRLGLDGQTLSYALYQELMAYAQQYHIQLSLKEDLVESIWKKRPVKPKGGLFLHEPKWVSLSSKEKITLLREKLEERGAQFHLICSLDDIAWITNLRGSDIPYNPVFLAYLVISRQQTTLYVDEVKLEKEIELYLTTQGITIKPYQAVEIDLAALPQGRLCLDPHKVSYALVSQIPEQVTLDFAANPSTLLKACKAPLELAHIREAMVQDGIALCEFLCWLDQQIAAKRVLSELDIDEELTRWRTLQANFVTLSFPTIVGFNANSALPHYIATKDCYSHIKGNGILLIDSGAQYYNGTTDITRVIAINEVSPEQRKDFTLVLKSHIAMASLFYPKGIAMPMLDAVARAPLWREGLDFGHGTGHGVGYFLNVHEGPQVLSYYATPKPETSVQAGMVTSIEPGLYRTGAWGIRIENLAASIAVNKGKSGLEEFLKFEILTLCPIDQRLIETKYLNKEEKEWINSYHTLVRERLYPHVAPSTREWLVWATREL
ncbi:MAG: aminopeptidase P family protein [Neisseriaceae bacterium]